MAIALVDVLDERQIALQLKARRQPNALREIIGLFENTDRVREPAKFLEQVLAREKANSTLGENAVAFLMPAPSRSTRSHSQPVAAAPEFHGTATAIAHA